jgi:hypothetical protein
MSERGPRCDKLTDRSKEQLLSAYEYGVWFFLAVAGGTALGLIAYLVYLLL